MGKPDFVELSINIRQLAQDLYSTEIATGPIYQSLKTRITKCEEALKKNVAEEKIDNFLSKLELIFIENDDMQPRMLLAQFIKETLSDEEFVKFKTLIKKTPGYVIWPETMLEVLDELA